jgi:hypothetical protein
LQIILERQGEATKVQPWLAKPTTGIDDMQMK